MDAFTNTLVRCAVSAFSLPDPVVEIGALQYGEPGSGKFDLRAHFPGRPYIGCDLEKGPGVDRIEDVTRLSFKDGEVGTILTLHLLEHVWDVFAACREMTRVVKPGGAALVICPFAVHLHRYPKDFWRFTDDSMKKLLEGFPWLIVGRRGYDSMPREVFALGFKADAFPDFDRRCEAFREMLTREGKEVAPFLTRLRMGLGSALFRKKYFREFVNRNDITLDLVKPR
jgi:SAM-dependent methyltransferase